MNERDGQRLAPDWPVDSGALTAQNYKFRHPPMSILLICDDQYPAQVVQEHIAALQAHSRHRFTLVNPYRTPGRLPVLSSFHAVVIHYSILIISDSHLPKAYRDAIARFGGLKVLFLQDEYRWINRIVHRMCDLGIHVLFSVLRPETARTVYHERCGLNDCVIFSTLPGFIPEALVRTTVPLIRQRRIHATYRTREVPYWLGQHSRQKVEIAAGFQALADTCGLRVDIATGEEDRVYGQHWVDLILSGKAILGTEGGASIFDFDSQVEQACDDYLRRHPGADFDEVHRNVLATHEGNVVHGALTPRVFEAIALRTALVLFPGRYAGILQPGRHYVVLQRDFSNAAEVVDKLRDDDYLQELVDRTYEDVVGAGVYSYAAAVSQSDVATDLAVSVLIRTGMHARTSAPAIDLTSRHLIGVSLRIRQEKDRLTRELAKTRGRVRRLTGRLTPGR